MHLSTYLNLLSEEEQEVYEVCYALAATSVLSAVEESKLSVLISSELDAYARSEVEKFREKNCSLSTFLDWRLR